jgi:3-keto-disaccharide hydrolase
MRFPIVLLIALLGFSCGAPGEAADATPPNDPNEKEWAQLFNSENLDGWHVKINGYELDDNFGNTFRVEDGVMNVSYDQYEDIGKRFGHIFHEKIWGDYLFAVEYRFVGEQAPGGEVWVRKNSGVMVHGQPAETMLKDQSFPISIEVQLLGGYNEGDRPTGNLCTPGTHVVMDGELIETHCINAAAKTYNGEEWVRMEIEVIGDESVNHIIDGETVIEYTKPQIGGGVVEGFDPAVEQDGKALTEGSISLQSESHPIEFREVEILSLKDCMDEKAACVY